MERKQLLEKTWDYLISMFDVLEEVKKDFQSNYEKDPESILERIQDLQVIFENFSESLKFSGKLISPVMLLEELKELRTLYEKLGNDH